MQVDRCGNYLIEDFHRLGRGAFGEVFEVKVHNLTKTYSTIYARKYFSPSPEYDTEIKELTDIRHRFLVEIKTQCLLNKFSYDTIAPIVLFNTNGEKPYFVMEKAESNLGEAIESGMSDSERKQAILQIITGVGVIHNNEYIHRDLKPANILKYINRNEEKTVSYKITDFGLVKDFNDVRAELKTKFQPNYLGTDGYRAPEIKESGLFSPQSDIFAIGKIISDIYNKGRNSSLKNVISKCCNQWPEDRYQNTNDLLSDFLKAIEE